MTEASAGLRKALARKAGVSKLTTEELLAEMSDEQKTAIAAALAPAAGATEAMEPEEDEDEMEDGKKKPKSMKKHKNMDEDEDDGMEANAAADRAVAVLSHEHAQGRMDSAKKLLANDKLSADEIISILADMAPAETPDPEAAALAEMQAAITETSESNIEANDRPSTTSGVNALGVWDAAIARVFGNNPA